MQAIPNQKDNMKKKKNPETKREYKLKKNKQENPEPKREYEKVKQSSIK